LIERTLAILKPDCISHKLEGEIIARIGKAGFTIIAMKTMRLTKETAAGFYAVHRGRTFFESLLEYMSSGNCVPMILEKENAVADFRTFIGATDPREANPGTIRREFAESKERNIIHGSDSAENAGIEIAFFFSRGEIVGLTAP
jgi:nucleoside-diphosphate kinase